MFPTLEIWLEKKQNVGKEIDLEQRDDTLTFIFLLKTCAGEFRISEQDSQGGASNATGADKTYAHCPEI